MMIKLVELANCFLLVHVTFAQAGNVVTCSNEKGLNGDIEVIHDSHMTNNGFRSNLIEWCRFEGTYIFYSEEYYQVAYGY